MTNKVSNAATMYGIATNPLPPTLRNECGLSPENLAPGNALFLQWRMPLAMIIVIGWLYVTILVAASEPSLVAGILSFLFYGALPSGLILYFSTSRVRRERRKYREMMAEKAGRETGGTRTEDTRG